MDFQTTLDHRNCFLAHLHHPCDLSSLSYRNRLFIINNATSHMYVILNHSQTVRARDLKF